MSPLQLAPTPGQFSPAATSRDWHVSIAAVVVDFFLSCRRPQQQHRNRANATGLNSPYRGSLSLVVQLRLAPVFIS